MGRYCPPFRPMVEVLPEKQETVCWDLHAFEMTREQVDFQRTMSIFSFQHGETYDLVPDRYMRLVRKYGPERQRRVVVMTDTPMERRTNLEFVQKARGRVLIGGLGIGMVLVPLAANPEVEQIVVIERDEELPRLILPALSGLPGMGKLLVHGGQDVFQWVEKYRNDRTEKGRYDTVYFDIWNEISDQNWEQQKLLRRRARPLLAPGGWLSSWRERDCQRLARGD